MCLCTCTCAHKHVAHTLVHARVCTCICEHVHTHGCVYACMHMSARMHACLCVSVHMRVRVHIHACMLACVPDCIRDYRGSLSPNYNAKPRCCDYVYVSRQKDYRSLLVEIWHRLVENITTNSDIYS